MITLYNWIGFFFKLTHLKLTLWCSNNKMVDCTRFLTSKLQSGDLYWPFYTSSHLSRSCCDGHLYICSHFTLEVFCFLSSSTFPSIVWIRYSPTHGSLERLVYNNWPIGILINVHHHSRQKKVSIARCALEVCCPIIAHSCIDSVLKVYLASLVSESVYQLTDWLLYIFIALV